MLFKTCVIDQITYFFLYSKLPGHKGYWQGNSVKFIGPGTCALWMCVGSIYDNFTYAHILGPLRDRQSRDY